MLDWRIDWMDSNRFLNQTSFSTEQQALDFAHSLSFGLGYNQYQPFSDRTLARYESCDHKEFITVYHKDAYK